MGFAGRLFRFAKAYLSVTSEKLDRVAREVEAEAELKHSTKAPDPVGRMRGGLVDLPPIPASSTQASLPLASDYRLLGVPYDADLSAVEDAWRRLAQRADPKRFPAGSQEEKRAAEILHNINAAYERIREAKSPTEGRFGKLEL